MPICKKTCPECSGKKDRRSKMCQPCRFKLNHPRKGTGKNWHKHSTGYIIKNTNGTTIYQHRYIMEEYLGRKLKQSEHVHHKNHDRSDNRIENLEVISASNHAKKHFEPRKYEMSRLGHLARWGYGGK